MKEILKIHNENKVKVESQSNIDNVVGGSDGSDADDDEATTLKKIKSNDSSKSSNSVKEFTQVAPMLSKLSSVGDGQAYLESISGVKDQLDQDTSSVIGKLLVKEDEEDLTPDNKTYGIVAGMIGGVSFFAFYIGVQVIRRIQWHFQGKIRPYWQHLPVSIL